MFYKEHCIRVRTLSLVNTFLDNMTFATKFIHDLPSVQNHQFALTVQVI